MNSAKYQTKPANEYGLTKLDSKYDFFLLKTIYLFNTCFTCRYANFKIIHKQPIVRGQNKCKPMLQILVLEFNIYNLFIHIHSLNVNL